MTAQSTSGITFDAATLEILWSRLTGVCEEMWNTILRTSYSTIIGAALDYGVALLDATGGQLAHASGSMPLLNKRAAHDLPRPAASLRRSHSRG